MVLKFCKRGYFYIKVWSQKGFSDDAPYPQNCAAEAATVIRHTVLTKSPGTLESLLSSKTINIIRSPILNCRLIYVKCIVFETIKYQFAFQHQKFNIFKYL